MVVDVKPSARSSAAAPEASELEIHPLVRGYVDAVDATAGTLSVMGQSIQLTSTTNFSDHRACVASVATPCAAVTGSSGLTATTGTGAAASAGSYVTVHGFLFGASAASASVVATLVSVSDVPPSSTTGVNFKVEGQVNVGATSTSIGGLTLDLSTANCFVARTKTPCASAFASGQVVAASGTSVAASSVVVLHAVNSVSIGLFGDVSNVLAGVAANTYTLSVLGQPLTVNSQTRLADMSVRGWDHKDPAVNPFNINTFVAYLGASVSQHVIVKAETDASGALLVRSLVIVPASTVAGLVDGTPAVANSATSGTPSTFSVRGIAVSADPAAVIKSQGMQGRGKVASMLAIAAGDRVAVIGTYANGLITVGRRSHQLTALLTTARREWATMITAIFDPQQAESPGLRGDSHALFALRFSPAVRRYLRSATRASRSRRF